MWVAFIITEVIPHIEVTHTHTHTQILRYSQKYDRRAEKISQRGLKKTPDFAHDRSFLLNK